MKTAMLGIGLALGLSIGCVESTVTCPFGEVDTETSTLAEGEGKYCRYYNPHGKGTDCRYYDGDWTQDDIRLDCSDAMGQFMAKPGTLSSEECDPGNLVGTCTADKGAGRQTVTYFYEGDAGALNSFCETAGIWTPGGPILEGVALALPEALQALESDTAVAVEPTNCQDTDCLEQIIEDGDWFEFRPLAAAKEEGVIFFPGGAVDPRAYAPTARAFAEAGYFTVIAPHYGSTAKKVAAIMGDNTEHADWFMGGHSFGGVTTLSYLWSQPAEAIAGIYLWGASGTAVYDVSNKTVDALVVYADQDGLTTELEVEVGKPYMPNGTIYERIVGGNHAQFGYYNKLQEDDDGTASLTREAQQQLAIDVTLDLFDGTL